MPSPPLQDMTGKVTKTERLLARGTLGDVWTGTFLWGDSSEIVAIKVARDVRYDTHKFDELKAQLIGEAHLWSQLDHPNIMPFYGVCYGLGPESAPSLVSPFFSNGDLAGYLNNNPNADKMVLVSQIADGLAYLHARNVIHGDMKSANVLVNDKHEACITDFGLSINVGESHVSSSAQGTRRWLAYELIVSDKAEISLQTDTWSFAMTVLEIFSGRFPFFWFTTDEQAVIFVARGGQPTHKRYPEIGGHLWSVLEQCWNSDPLKRPSMESLLLNLV